MSPINILVIEKSGIIKETVIKSYNEAELYKKAGLKSVDDFKCRAQWNIDNLNGKNYSVSVFGKITGRANQENKYDFPPPIDTTLMFGNVVIVNKNKDTNEPISIKEEEWESVYEYLFGGFDEIGDKDSEEEEEEEEEDLPHTKDGYVKDGFIVDDDSEEEDYAEDEEEEDYEEED
jgi:hypothetical protein